MPDTREVIDSSDCSVSPVFVDVTGRRRRRLRRFGYAAAALCGGYSIMLGVSLAGGPVSPQTLLPKVGGGGTKAVPSPKHRSPGDDGSGALPAPRTPSPVRTSGTPQAPRPSGDAPSGAVPSPPASDERRAGSQAPASTPTRTPSRAAGGQAPAAPPETPETPPAAPAEPGEPAAPDERRGDAEAETTGAQPQTAAVTPVAAEDGQVAAGVRE